MRVPAKYVAWLLPLALTGCFQKHQVQNQPLAPPISEPMPQAPQTDTAKLPPPVITVPSDAKPTTEANLPAKPPPKPVKRHKKPESKPPEEAASGVPAVAAMGQLSSGDPPDLRRQTEDSIVSTEKGLKALGRLQNEPDQKTVEHIREFLKQARQALADGDLDGASTLAAKARVLLQELQH